MKIPFFKPDITNQEIDSVVDVLKSGWIATGSINHEFCDLLSTYNQTDHCTLVDSATAGLEMALRYFGIKEGDEVITTPYTYAATAHVIKYCGATPVFVDINRNDFNIDPQEIRKKINSKTKAIISVDYAGFPVDYDGILQVLEEEKSYFSPNHETQERLGRALFVSDAAHSLGSMYNGKRVGSQADITVFSFHAVKNITTAEGGAIVYSDKPGFDAKDLATWLKLWTQHGQSKTAFEKNEQGSWFYDIKVPGYRHNLPDILAVIGLSQFKRYQETLEQRFFIMDQYLKLIKDKKELIAPVIKDSKRKTNGHFFPIRLSDPKMRDAVIRSMLENYGVSLNVHFIPLPLHTAYKNEHSMETLPNSLWNYERQISLPVYHSLGKKEIEYIIQSLLKVIEKYQ